MIRLLGFVALFVAACQQPQPPTVAAAATPVAAPALPVLGPNQALATFAGGCFWCMEKPFDELPGVVSTTSGFTGGRVVNPTYRQVTGGGTGHTEAVQVVYDTTRISYAQLLDVFWRNVDPLDGGGQFCDRGTMYRPGIFYHDAAQRTAAEASKQRVAARFSRPVAVEVTAFAAFYAAEEYHQDFYRKNPARYTSYRQGCGRDRVLRERWGA